MTPSRRPTPGITRPATKHNYLVKRSGDLARVMHDAFYVASPADPARWWWICPGYPDQAGAAVEALPRPRRTRRYRPVTAPDPKRILEAVQALKRSERRAVYAGGGVINSGEASRLLRNSCTSRTCPAPTAIKASVHFPASDKQFIGMLGMHRHQKPNLTMHGCDVMFNIGARFDDRITGRLDAFSPGSKIHADIDPPRSTRM